MFCSKKVKVIASIAFVLSQTLSVFAADPFADNNVTEDDIKAYFFTEETAAVELTPVTGALSEVKTPEDGEDIPYSEYRAFSNSDVSLTYYPAAFSAEDSTEGRLGLGNQLFAFTNNKADDFAYDSSWWTFKSGDKSYLGTLAKTADEDPLVYAYVIFDVTDSENVKLYYKKTLSQSGEPVIGNRDGETVFVVTQAGTISDYVAEPYHFTDTGIEKAGEDVFAFNFNEKSIRKSAMRSYPDSFNKNDYMKVVGTLKDGENNSYLFVYNRHPNRGITKVENRLLVYQGQKLIGYYPTINKEPVLYDPALEAEAEAENAEVAEAAETTETENSVPVLKFKKVSDEDGNTIDVSKGLPEVIYVLGDSHVLKEF
ncbi:MAG: hypothetical protein J5930_08285 [Treponema sp.]|nr:hypothetical protein [Treponema sp.]